MFTFHKPKVFRSSNGCCICGAKSSSSRFTDSKKYEGCFKKCFDITEERCGEICNACVLLVKRYMKLPAGSTRNWNHVVDARSGPGIKSLVKSKKKKAEEQPDTPEKIKKKHVYKRKNKEPVRQRNPSIQVSDFLDMSIWKRQKICCGSIFVGPFGEVVLDSRFFTPCNGCKLNGDDKPAPPAAAAASVVPDATKLDSPMDEDEDYVLDSMDDFSDEGEKSPKGSEMEDEGFFDKVAASPEGGSSPTSMLNAAAAIAAAEIEEET